MQLTAYYYWPPGHSASNSRIWPFMFLVLVLSALCVSVAHGMTDDHISDLRRSAQDLFYHGFDNYMKFAFPEDELLPISCKPLTRSRQDIIDNFHLNDVLGNYSLTLIDSLSTLAILASGGHDQNSKRNPLRDFQDGVKSLVELYGDRSETHQCGTRACGFDLDSKVQVFETNIRGVGGLLSAHLFAQGDLPIKGYKPIWKKGSRPGIEWKNGFRYHGQLLRLAKDLAERLLPAFSTSTDIPYPRVNLRHGITFYQDAENGFCRADGTSTESREVTETCAAGAGSLVLEFTALSRMTGDTRFEDVAKKAFWAIWNRRSSLNLVGSGIDAETAQWMPANGVVQSGIGAGIDSFFEYSLKSHILLSNLPYNANNYSTESPDSFLRVWEQAHAAVKRHIYRRPSMVKHPFYGQVDTFSGGDRATWIDNLSAYWPGLLVLAGEVDEAIESHLLWSALWTKFGALPERWHVGSNYFEPWAKKWAGRPEFIESTYYLFQATKDPYYLHVGEMILRDIRQRCWTQCGWASLDDITTGKQGDRMESFFLGETAKYLYLLFTPDHPLNKLDRPIVFTTEGHPLVVPDRVRADHPLTPANKRDERLYSPSTAATCPAPPLPLPLTVSNTANRADLFHAAALVQLHLVPIQLQHSSPLEESSKHSPGISFADVRSPTNYTFYPWTLPQSLVPAKGLSSPIINPITSTLTFPAIGSDTAQGFSAQNVPDGILLMSLSNARLGMIQEPRRMLLPDGQELVTGGEYRINTIANLHLGKDQQVLLTGGALKDVNADDPHFTRHRDLEMIDLVLDLALSDEVTAAPPMELETLENGTFDAMWDELDNMLNKILSGSGSDYKPSEKLRSNARNSGNARAQVVPTSTFRPLIPAILPTGIGSIPPGVGMEIDVSAIPFGQLPQKDIYFLEDTLCNHRLPSHIAKNYQILIVQRGGCSFGEKLANIPSFLPSTKTLQLVVVISNPSEANGDAPHHENEHGLIRPLLDEVQKTPNGILRPHPIALCMVDGGHVPTVRYGADNGKTEDVASLLRRVSSVVAAFDDDESVKVSEVKREKGSSSGIGVKRRYSFASMGVPIANLHQV